MGKMVPERRNWRAIGKYYYYKLVRQAGTPEYLARGTALGLFVGFLVPIGFQLLIVLPLAILFKASKVLAGSCTFVTNWVTVIVIYPIQCLVGSYLLFQPLNYASVKRDFAELVKIDGMVDFLKALFNLGLDVAIPFLVGGLVFGLVFGALGYWLTLTTVRAYRHRRALRLQRLQSGR